MGGGTEVAARPLGLRASFAAGMPRDWGWVAGLAALDLLWCLAAGIRIEGLWPQALSIAVLMAIGLAYRGSRRNPRIADACEIAALWVGFSIAGCVLTYLCATLRLPLQDAAFARADRLLGFDWQGWKAFVDAHAALRLLLGAAYASFMAQLLASILFFAFTGRGAANRELFRAALLSLLATSLVSGLLPALSAFDHYGLRDQAPYLHDLEALRRGVGMRFAVAQLQGIVTLPSYHAVLALLVAWSHRRSPRWLALLALVWNGLMLVSIPSEGGHYAVDILAGAVVVALVVPVVREKEESSFS